MKQKQFKFRLECCDYLCWLTLPVREPAPQLDCPKCLLDKLTAVVRVTRVTMP